jgi:hypothetical protein
MIAGDGSVDLLKLHHDLIGLVGDWKPYLDTRSCRNTTIRVSFGGRWRGDTLSGTHTTVEVSGLVGSGRTTNGFTSLDRLVTQHRPTQKRKSQTTARLLDTRDHGDGGIMKGREAVCHDGTGRIAWMGGRHVSLLYPDWLAVFAPSQPGSSPKHTALATTLYLVFLAFLSARLPFTLFFYSCCLA